MGVSASIHTVYLRALTNRFGGIVVQVAQCNAMDLQPRSGKAEKVASHGSSIVPLVRHNPNA